MSAEGIAIREFARRDGCHESLVRKALRRGNLVAGPGGKLDAQLVGTGWRRSNIDQSKAGTDRASLAEALRRKENALAGLRQIELDKALESLVPVEEAAGMIAAEYAAVRRRLLHIPIEVAEPVAATTRPAEVQHIIAAAINRALQDLSL